MFGVPDFDINTTVENASEHESVKNIVGVVGFPIDIKTDEDFESAQISFKISEEVLKTTDINNLVIFYYDEENDTIKFLETEVDEETNTIKTTVDHFSIYGVIDIVRFAQSWGIKDILDKLLNPGGETIPPVAEIGQADIVFVIDTTGSMGSVINNVKNNITNFANTLMENNVDVRLGLIDYKDLEEDGMDSTKNLGWFDNVSDFIASVNNMRATGGGDAPESTVDALEEARRMDFRPGVNKFIMLFTDVSYKESTRFEDVQSMKTVIEKLKEDKIVVSAIVPSGYESLYRNLYTETGGVYANITQAFSSALQSLISNIASVTHGDGVWIRLSNGMLKKLEGVSSKEELLEMASGGYLSVGDLFFEEVTVDFFGLKVKTFREAFNKNAVDVRITPTSGYSGGMYTVDAVATIVTKQQVDKAVLLFRLLNGNWMQYNAGLDSKFIMSKYNFKLPEEYPERLNDLFIGYRTSLNILDSGLREFKVVLFDKEGRIIVESAVNKVKVESSIKWTGDLSPLETVIGTKNFSIAQNANLLAGEKIALFLRKDGEQFPVMVDSSEQKYKREQNNYNFSFVSNDWDAVNKRPKYTNGVYWISVHITDGSGKSLIKSDERKIKINNIWISEYYNSGQNKDIYDIKKRLNELGYFGQNNLQLTVNTVFDYNTSFAVSEFKRVNRINDNGIFKGVVCDQTWNVLFSDSALRNDKSPSAGSGEWNFQSLKERLRFLSAAELEKEISDASKEKRSLSPSAELTKRLNLINSRIANDWVSNGVTKTRFAKRYLDQCAKNGITPPAEYNTEAKVIKALTWNDEKIEKLYRNSLQFQNLDIDPRLLLAIIIQEGTGSFNTNPEVKDSNGGHYIQPDFEKDLKAALDNQFLRKANAYRYYGEQFSEFVSGLKVSQPNLTSGKGNLYQFLNYATMAATVDLNTNEIIELKPHGVYATHDGWWKNVEAVFNSLVDNNGEKPAEKYSNLFKSSKKVPLKSGYSKPTVVFKLEWINEVIYNSKTEKYDPGYTIKATLASQTTPEEPKPTENVFPLKYGDTSAVKGSYIKEVHDLLSKNLGSGLEYLKIADGDAGYGKNYGPKTTALVKLYQSQNGAAVNGQIDEATLNKLRKGEWKVVAPSEGKYVIKGSYQDSYFELVVDKAPDISDTGDFSLKLKRLVEEYTDFNINGVKVKLPYYQTVGTRYGGKSTPEQIRNFILGKTTDPSKFQSVADDPENRHKVGVDCSGLVAYVLNEATEGAIHKTHGQTGYANGISAAALTNTKLGQKITRAKDIVPGAIMNTDDGGHVIVIYEVVKTNGKVTQIKYAHSNGKHGPHKGYIDIGDENQDLDGSAQTWHDISYTDQKAKELYTYTILRNEVIEYLKK
ncbi:VWA domain-containing protein [Acetivibrio saccincola]|uniref:VWA domain-containing protein n=1 Tax=Acetivibrio saccincola TaxID=1677857 RepID=A0A2S8REL2_9FIRM|nr:VWA domain-containing protein [Acetivibrio saccincola]